MPANDDRSISETAIAHGRKMGLEPNSEKITVKQKKRVVPPNVVALANAMCIPIDKDYFNELATIECGLHSGYPTCCIAFHQNVIWPASSDFQEWLDGAEPTTASESYCQYMDALAKSKVVYQSGYLPCWACFFAQRVLVPIPCSCGKKNRLERKTGKRAYPFRHDVTPGCVVFNGAERADPDATTPKEPTA
ncbi:MAG: hypothetical protein K8U57_31625 [Planctomycetes bacterium]|nr:hypothetical protein [Planctomycetota bacterium]